jgi:voltage-gated sodium channel
MLAVFTVEIAAKLLAQGARPAAYFQSRWNGFDFVVVFLSYAFAGSAVPVLRLLRLLRLLKLVRALPQLQVTVATALSRERGTPSHLTAL